MRVKVTRNYQITIPAEIRSKAGLKLGDMLEVNYDEERGEIVLRKLSEERKRLRAGKKLTPDEIESLIIKGLGSSL